MIQEISFFVEGEPRAKQSFRSLGRRGGYTPARVKAWQTDVAWAAQLRMRALGLMEPITGNLTVELTFFLGTARRIDSDNLSKAVQDGLNGVVWEDDQQNIRLVVEKYICRGRQGVLVRITPSDRALEITQNTMESLLYVSARGWTAIGVNA
jgi:Holliday junction resolvase RusA-like endonuclease